MNRSDTSEIGLHKHCVLSNIGLVCIPKSKVFRFENYWLKLNSFKDIVQAAWNIPVGYTDPAKKINVKFKNL